MSCEFMSPGNGPSQYWREAVEMYGMTLDDARRWNNNAPIDDVRWLRNAMASDLIACSCGAIGSQAEWHPLHDGEGEEVRFCKKTSADCAAALASIVTQRGDEGDHTWFPVVAPREPNQPYTVLDDTALRRACGGALCPHLAFERKPLEQYIDNYEARTREHAVSEYPDEAEQYVAKQIGPYRNAQQVLQDAGCTDLCGWRPLEIDPRSAAGRCLGLTCVYPHFMLGLTPGGSVVGVAGLTVWT